MTATYWLCSKCGTRNHRRNQRCRGDGELPCHPTHNVMCGIVDEIAAAALAAGDAQEGSE